MFLVRLLYYVLDVVGWEIKVLTVVVFFFSGILICTLMNNKLRNIH